MATTTFDVGDKPTFTASFYNTADTLTDPTTVVFTWRTSAGVETSYTYGTDSEVTKSSTGIYVFAAPTIAAAGPHYCRAKGTAGLVTAGVLGVGVRANKFTS